MTSFRLLQIVIFRTATHCLDDMIFILDSNSSTTCTVQDLNITSPHQPTLFGVGVEDGPLAVTNAFYWNNDTNAVLVVS